MNEGNGKWRVGNPGPISPFAHKEKVVYEEGFLHRARGNSICFKNKNANKCRSNNRENTGINPFSDRRLLVLLNGRNTKKFIFFIKADVREIYRRGRDSQQMLIKPELAKRLYKFYVNAKHHKPTH